MRSKNTFSGIFKPFKIIFKDILRYLQTQPELAVFRAMWLHNWKNSDTS